MIGPKSLWFDAVLDVTEISLFETRCANQACYERVILENTCTCGRTNTSDDVNVVICPAVMARGWSALITVDSNADWGEFKSASMFFTGTEITRDVVLGTELHLDEVMAKVSFLSCCMIVNASCMYIRLSQLQQLVRCMHACEPGNVLMAPCLCESKALP